MPAAYRSPSRLVLDVLRAVHREGRAQITRLQMLANLPHTRLRGHLDDLTAKGWLEELEDDGRRAWRLTPKGRDVLHELERMEEAMQDFGLAL